MEIAITNVLNDKLRKDFQLNIPSQIVSNKIQEHINKILPEFTLEGYNKGQVPIDVIKEKFGKTFMAEQTDILISETLAKIIDDNKYKLVTTPKIDFKTFEEGKNVELTATFEIFPDMPEVELKNIKLPIYKAEITDTEIDEAVQRTLRSAMNWVNQGADYQAQIGDITIINYTGTIDGKTFEGADGKDFRLELGTKTFIDNFEEQLVGKTIGQKTQISVSFPDDYFRPALSNKKAIFVVEITGILKAENVNFDNDFIAKTTGFEDIEDLQEAIFNRMNFDYSNTCRAIFKKDLFDYLDANYKIDMPAGLVNEQTNFLKNMNNQNNALKKASDPEKELKLSQRMVRCGLILADIASKNGVQVTQEEVDNEIKNMVDFYPDQKDEILKNYKNNQQAFQQLVGAILEEKAVNFILNQIQIEEVIVSTKQIDRMWFDISNN